MMRHRLLKSLVVVAATVATGAWVSSQVAVALTPASTLSFAGTSTVKDWKCSAPVMTASIDAAASDVAAKVLAGEKVVRTVRLTIPAGKLDCKNGTMNGHMYKALNTTAQPTIVFTLSSYELTGAPTARTGTMLGTLSINGTEQAVSLPVIFEDAGNGSLRVKGEHKLQMTKYGVKPPTLMLGTMKVGDAVTVAFDLVLKA
jgi:polyisoprenoid-binding protein YceI